MKKDKNSGWIKIHRKIKEKAYYKKSAYIHLWIHLLLEANHKEKEFMFNDKIFIVKEGQLLTGRKELSADTGISESTIERILKLLENEQQIEQQTTTKFRIITIINWKNYQYADLGEQQNEQPADNKRTTSGQQADTNKNVKNDKNVKEYTLVETWNSFAETNKLSKVLKVTDKRLSHIKKRMLEKEFNFEEILAKVSQSDFLLGKKTDWKIDFDFIVTSKNNYIKILENKYQNNGKSVNIPESGGKDELMTFYKSQSITEDFDTWWQKYYTYNSGTARYSKKQFIKN